jgi:hypothetical protein
MKWSEYFSDEETPFPSPNPKLRHPNRRTNPAEEIVSTIGDPKVFLVEGGEKEFFTVGQLAMALGRKAVTIRAWEANGVIPIATYSAPSDDPRGRRRLYSREQVEGIVQIAGEEGILEETWKPIGATRFKQRVLQLFEELASEDQ